MSEQAKFTPGPWRVNYSHFSQVLASNGALIAKCERLNSLTTLQANAQLIAAAPELLEALELVIGAHEHGCGMDDQIAVAKLVRARALGQ